MKDCGVLLPISSLPSPYGIGSLGKEARAFAEFLAKAGQTYWQVLPVVPTSYGDSPYQSPSSFAGNPYFIDLSLLCEQGLLTQAETDGARVQTDTVDYGALFATRLPLLRKAYARFDTSDESFVRYCRDNAYWLDDHALFSALKTHFSGRPHWEWDEGFSRPDTDKVRAFAQENERELNLVRFLQYLFDTQWQAFKSHCNGLGVRIIGDAPIYAAYDSADFWANKDLFDTDAQGRPVCVAGVPPDYFSADGQLWGNPLYDWDALEKSGYAYWIARLRRAQTLFDRLRIDHFRGFCAYYAIPAGASTAREGVWKEGPGKALFDAIHKAVPGVDIIAEDLGVDSPELRALLRECGYPGMKVLQFGFDGDPKYNAHAPMHYTANAVGYTGTHDNDTSVGWFSALTDAQKANVRRRLPHEKDIAKAMICALYRSRVQTAIIPMQDWLREGSGARMNTPGVAAGNWQYRMQALPPIALQKEMRATAERYGRAR